MMNNIRNLRLINIFGAASFATYGFLIKSYPVVLLNSFIVLIDLFYLYKIFTERDYFNINDTLTPDDFFIDLFLRYYAKDIEYSFPGFNIKKISHPKIILISRNLKPVGMFIYEEKAEGVIYIHLDFAIPAYRDTKNVRYIFMTKSQELKEQGFHTFKTRSVVKHHQRYLKRIGFTQEDGDIFTKRI